VARCAYLILEQAKDLDLCIERGWQWLHESGTYLKFTDSGAALFA
jgi:hypothetical protein